MIAWFSPHSAPRATMRVPLVVRRPVARRDDDGQLVQLRRHRRVEAHRRAELLREVAHLRAAEQDVERPRRSTTLARDQVLEHLLLRRRHRRDRSAARSGCRSASRCWDPAAGARAWVLCGHDAHGSNHADEQTPEATVRRMSVSSRTDIQRRRTDSNRHDQATDNRNRTYFLTWRSSIRRRTTPP